MLQGWKCSEWRQKKNKQNKWDKEWRDSIIAVVNRVC